MAELSEAKKSAIRSLIYARSELKAAGFATEMVETVGLDTGGLDIRLDVKGLNISDANYLVNEAFGLPERAA